jgi:type IV secretion system protein VirD4
MKELRSLRYWLFKEWKGREVHGKARWMNWWERRGFFGKRHDGLVFGPGRRISRTESFKNLALIAPTGSGKTTRFVIPNLLSLEGSAVVTDPSGEIYRATAGHLAGRGFHIEVLQPAEVGRSLRFNPLAYLQGHQALGELARTLAQYGNQGEGDGGGEAFWTHGAADILSIGLHALQNVADPRYRTLGNLRWLLNHFGHAGEGITGFLGRHLDARMRAEFLGFVHQDPKVIASVLSTARAGLLLWNDPEICRLTAADSVGVRELRQRKTVVYLIVPESRIPYFSLILNLFYRACFRECLEHWDEAAYRAGRLLPVYFFLDEFGNLGKIPHFETMITTLRKRACCISLILQQPAQLQAIYGPKRAESILGGGCASKLYLAGLDPQTALEVERQLGTETVAELAWGENTRRLGKPLLRAEEVRRMPARRGILISGRERPVYVKLPACYEVPAWRQAMETPPPPLPGSDDDPATDTEPEPYLPLTAAADGAHPGRPSAAPVGAVQV